MKDIGRAGVYLALFSEIGVVLLTTILGGVLAGAWIDQQLHTRPVLALLGALLGLASGGVVVIRLINRFLTRFE